MADKKEDKKEKPASEYFQYWDKVEMAKDQVIEFKGTYPKPASRYRVILEAPNVSIEPLYFWMLSQFRGIGYHKVDKISDIFSASEQSSLFGQGQSRLGVTQDRIMSFLRIIHDMIKIIPNQVRELRVIKERLSYYDASFKQGDKAEAAEKTLKGLYVDLVEGGTKNPGSVFGLSQQVGFVVLPDLFFRTRMNPDEDEEKFFSRIKKLSTDEGGEFNQAVISILQRKLVQYYTWKQNTYKEIKQRQKYLLTYMKQVYSTTKLYMTWVKPYLKLAKNMGIDVDRTGSPQLVRAFETSLLEVEVLARRVEKDSKDETASDKEEQTINNCMLITFNYRTKPSMSFATPDYQHRGPVHVGEAEITWRSYAWTDKDIRKFNELKEAETFQLLKDMNSTLREALEDVEGDFKKFLEEADQELYPKKEEEKQPEPPGFFAPITDITTGIHTVTKDMWDGTTKVITSFWPDTKKSKASGNKKGVEKSAKKLTFLCYKNFKKSYGLAAW